RRRLTRSTASHSRPPPIGGPPAPSPRPTPRPVAAPHPSQRRPHQAVASSPPRSRPRSRTQPAADDAVGGATFDAFAAPQRRRRGDDADVPVDARAAHHTRTPRGGPRPPGPLLPF